MADPAIVKKVRALLSRAVDPGATEEEQRTSAHIAAKLCREHGLNVGELGDGEPPTRARAEVVVDGVRMVIETIGAARSGVDSVLGFDLFGFAQELLRDRAKETITSVIKNPAPAPRRRRARARAKRPKPL